ncbi:hypothetical protein TrVFT333_009260 [Trichoderma virens FT-333]|nr:hypothetical protein TrVFT333_009260 [Trichoderma virens FT-333]
MSTFTDSPLTLFWSPGACSFVPHVALCETGLKFDLVLAKVGHMTKEFEAINPKRRVPVLVMGKEIITEMAAVLTAIATAAPEAHIFGQTPLRRFVYMNGSTICQLQHMDKLLQKSGEPRGSRITRRYILSFEQRALKKFDIIGTALTIVGVGLFTTALTLGPVDGWKSPHVIAMLIVGFSLLAGFVIWEKNCS